MTQTLHIFRKDVRRLKWLLVLWVGLLAAQTASAIVGPGVALSGFPQQLLIFQLDSVLAAAIVLMLALLVARQVHEEPLVGLDWFWISRPYDWRSLLGAKLLFLVLFFVAIPVATHLFVMVAFGADVADMIRAAPGFISHALRWALWWMVFAVVTRSLATYSIAIVSMLTAMVVLILGATAALFWRLPEDTPPDTSAPLADVSTGIVMEALFVVVAVAVIVNAYRNRRLARSLSLAGLGLAALTAVLLFWPWHFAAVWPLDFTKVQAFQQTQAILDLTRPPRLEDPWPGRSSGKRVLYVPTRLIDLPPDFRVQGTYASSRLSFADGHVLQSAQGGGTGVGEAPADAHPLQGMFPGARVVPIPSGNTAVPVAALVAATDDEIARYGTKPGRLTSRVSYNLVRSRIIRAMPLSRGGSCREGTLRVDILDVEGRRGGCTVAIRYWRASTLWSSSPARMYEFVLRNAQRQEVVVGSQNPLEGGVSPSFLPLMAIGWYGGAPQEGGFDVRHMRVDYPLRGESQTAVPALDRDWLAHAELVVLETREAGWLAKSVTVNEFQMQPVIVTSQVERHR